MLADSLAKALGTQGVGLQRSTRDQALAAARSDLIVLAGDAANDRGRAFLTRQLQGSNPAVPVLVICAPEPGAHPTQTVPHHIAYLSPAGGVAECAQRVGALLEIYIEEGLVACSLQQLADMVTSQTKPGTSSTKLPAHSQTFATAAKPPANTNAQTVAGASANAATGSPLSAASPAQHTALAKSLPTGILSSASPAIATPSITGEPAASAPGAPTAKAPTATASASVKRTAIAWDFNAARAAVERRAAEEQQKRATAQDLQPSAAAAEPVSQTAPVTSAALDAEPVAPREARKADEPAPIATKPEPSAETASGPASFFNHSPVSARTQPLPTGTIRNQPAPPAVASTRDQPNPTRTPAAGAFNQPAATQSTAAAGAFNGLASTRTPATAGAFDQPAATPTTVSTSDAPAMDVLVSFSEAPPSLPAPRQVEARAPAQQDVPQTRPAIADRVEPVVHGAAAPRLPPHRNANKAAAVEAPQKAPSTRPRRRTGNPLEPVQSWTPPPQPHAPRAANDLPVAQSPANAPSTRPRRRTGNPLEPVQSWTPPTSVPGASQQLTRSQSQRPRGRRTAGNPLEPAVMAQQPRADVPAATTSASAEARVGGHPLQGPTAQRSLADAAVMPPPAAKPRSRAPMLFAVAALCCAAVCFGWLYRGDDPDRNQAALGALQQVPTAVASPAMPDPQHIADPAAQATRAPATRSAAVPSNPTSVPRSNAPSRASEAGPEPTPAQKLVDEGTALASQGRLGLAESAYQKALRLSPEYPNAMAALVRVHIARRDGAEAVRWATRLVAKQPTNDAVNKLLLGDALALRGDTAAARDAWTEAAKRGNATARKRLE